MAEHLLIQVSDTHLTPEGTLLPGVHPGDSLRAGLQMLVDAQLRPDLVILTGDLADAGDPACYEDLRRMMEGAAGAIGAGVAYLPGNHDVRAEFRRHLLDASPVSDPINQVHWCGGLRVLSLDSVVEGEEFGVLSDETLAFLRGELAMPAADGTVVALHHPPIPSPIEPMSRLRLRNPDDLADVIAGSDVRLILCGHNHHDSLGTLASVPVWVSPSVAYRMDVLSRRVFRKVPGSAFSQVVLGERDTTVSVLPVPLHSTS
jgi:3',5'-cyclic-AMP phosphodiesterase